MCLATTALMLFLTKLPSNIITTSEDTVTINATVGDVKWEYIGNDVWSIDGKTVCLKTPKE